MVKQRNTRRPIGRNGFHNYLGHSGRALGCVVCFYKSLEAEGVLSNATPGPLSRPNAVLMNKSCLVSWVSQRQCRMHDKPGLTTEITVPSNDSTIDCPWDMSTYAIMQQQAVYLLNTRRNAVITGLMNARENAGAKYTDAPARSGSRASK